MELIDPVRMILGLLFTIGMLLVLWAGIRKFAPGMVQAMPKGQRRLKIIEALQLDTKRRLIVVKDGQKEHLILLGGATETVLESRKHTPDLTTRQSQNEA
ncbi:MAG: flagellar biosynthetic protein FliO [Robiginitomaculum sp.]|nr:flagellar biosynthetic protein FliO [Robiginitomaculum sp.]